VTGTDTGVGKTLLAACLLAAFPRARYAKPVQTGWPADDDAGTVGRLAVAGPERLLPGGVRLKAPVSPHHAASLERTRLSARDLAGLVTAAEDGRPWVVEGAGGLLTPLSERETMLDLARALSLPVVVAVAVRLGAINATLLTLRALDAAGLPVLGVVPMGPEDPSFTTGVTAHTRARLLVGVPRLADPSPDSVRQAAHALAQDRVLVGALA
jgi:malonyl-CoA O-methyltransferase